MNTKLPPNIYAQKYTTKGGRQRTLFYVRFKDWKGIRRKVPAGDNLAIAKKLRERLLGLNTLRHDFDVQTPDFSQDRPSLENWQRADPISHRLTKPNIGTVHELHVASDLMARGYFIFRSLSPNAPCDLIATSEKASKLYRIEVTGAKKGKKVKALFNKHDPACYDILALAYPNGLIEYIPPLAELGAQVSKSCEPNPGESSGNLDQGNTDII